MQSILLRQILAQESIRRLGVAPGDSPPDAGEGFRQVLRYATPVPHSVRLITHDLRCCVRDADVEEGVLWATVPHVTCGLMVCETGPACPGEDPRRLLLLSNQSVRLEIRRGRLALAPWQDVALAEWEGPQAERRVEVVILPARHAGGNELDAK